MYGDTFYSHKIAMLYTERNSTCNLSFVFKVCCYKAFMHLKILWSRGQSEICGLFFEIVAPPGSKFRLLSGLIGMFWGLENPCCTKLSVAGFL